MHYKREYKIIFAYFMMINEGICSLNFTWLHPFLFIGDLKNLKHLNSLQIQGEPDNSKQEDDF